MRGRRKCDSNRRDLIPFSYLVTSAAYFALSVLIQLALAGAQSAAAFLTSGPAARVRSRRRTHENMRGTYRNTCTDTGHTRWCEPLRYLKVSTSPYLVWKLTWLCSGRGGLLPLLPARSRSSSTERKTAHVPHALLLALHVAAGSGNRTVISLLEE